MGVSFLTSAGNGNPGRRNNLFTCKQFGSLNYPGRFLLAACHVTSGFWVTSDCFNIMYINEIIFQQTEPTAMESMKTKNEKGVLRS